ncbi:PREDICTED: riboflavin kinase isoform X1 [Cercocebus atys]|uniref:riboflavin kinase isoform X1 n=1 Tax=Cercocebus atys TaxID=9531 RepID=UPI0005F3E6BB|nr:PREDICTED: riboflavin kinase isoform X1 [Cercocebus atys]
MPRADCIMRHLPYFCRGQVVRGFGRGSKQLGIPTANFPEQVVDNLPADISTGIYYGWASVGSGDVHKMVVSIGWNPYYKNTKKSMMGAHCVAQTEVQWLFTGQVVAHCDFKLVGSSNLLPSASRELELWVHATACIQLRLHPYTLWYQITKINDFFFMHVFLKLCRK